LRLLCEFASLTCSHHLFWSPVCCTHCFDQNNSNLVHLILTFCFYSTCSNVSSPVKLWIFFFQCNWEPWNEIFNIYFWLYSLLCIGVLFVTFITMKKRVVCLEIQLSLKDMNPVPILIIF
jgi:hypothetical protein